MDGAPCLVINMAVCDDLLKGLEIQNFENVSNSFFIDFTVYEAFSNINLSYALVIPGLLKDTPSRKCSKFPEIFEMSREGR